MLLLPGLTVDEGLPYCSFPHYYVLLWENKAKSTFYALRISQYLFSQRVRDPLLSNTDVFCKQKLMPITNVSSFIKKKKRWGLERNVNKDREEKVFQ